MVHPVLVIVYVIFLVCIAKGDVIKIPLKHMTIHSPGSNIRGSETLLEGAQRDEPDLSHRAVEARMNLGVGVHTVETYIGGQKRVLIVDTGSGDTAFPCTNCHHCGTLHANPFYSLGDEASYVSCAKNQELGLQDCRECSHHKCMYGQKYVEGSHWSAHKVMDRMTLGATGQFSKNVVFGCIYEEYGAFEDQTADGIMGMSRDADAIFLQFHREGAIESAMFSQCISRNGGSLTIGGVDTALNRETMKYTPLRQTHYHYWTVSLLSVQLGDKVLSVASKVYNEGRGCVLDSGTTFIYLPEAARSPFEEAWTQIVGSGHPHSEYRTGARYHLSHSQLSNLPIVCFNLQNGVQICVKPDQYMKKHPTVSAYTATIFFKNFAHATIIGASGLRNHNVVYDVSNTRIGIARADCDDVGRIEAALAIDTRPGGDTFKQIQTWDLKLISLCLVTMGLIIIAFVMNHTNEQLASREGMLMLEDLPYQRQ